jgi:caa(3)-type oxidase subunit IV
MNAESHTKGPDVTTVIQDPAADHVHAGHDQATEVAHAWEHFDENWKFFACFFGVVLLTVITFYINFGPWNLAVALFMATARCALIAYFMSHLFKGFSFVFRTFIFSAFFLAGMIFLSWWDSELGDPIKDRVNPPTEQTHVP